MRKITIGPIGVVALSLLGCTLVGCTRGPESSATSDGDLTKPGPGADGHAGGATDAPPGADDHGSVSTKYPAFTPDLPKLVNQGGAVLTNPVAVAVTWDGPNRATYEGLVDTIGATDYWKSIVGEYGVGPLTSGAANHVHETSTITLSTGPDADPVGDVVSFIKAKLQSPAASGWPAPTPQTIYTLFISGPTAESICAQGAGGLHDSVNVNGTDVAFALVLECAGTPAHPAVEDATISASHELGEAAVDPYPSVHPGWVGLDADHLGWELLMSGQDENADMCEIYDDAYGKYSTELPYMIQRQWSNASIAAGHGPCVPGGAAPYFNLAPLDAGDTLNLTLPPEIPFPGTSKGYKIDVGASRKIALGIYSDGATAPITVSAFESDPFSETSDPLGPTTTPTVDVQLDQKTGQNGEKVYLTIKVNQAPAHGATLVVVETHLDKQVSYLPLLVGPGAATGSTPAPIADKPKSHDGWHAHWR